MNLKITKREIDLTRKGHQILTTISPLATLSVLKRLKKMKLLDKSLSKNEIKIYNQIDNLKA